MFTNVPDQTLRDEAAIPARLGWIITSLRQRLIGPGLDAATRIEYRARLTSLQLRVEEKQAAVRERAA